MPYSKLTLSGASDRSRTKSLLTGINKLIDNLSLQNLHVVDSTATDQGADTIGSIKNYVDSIGTSEKATIYLIHNGLSNTTAYTLTTSETIPSNITFDIEDGAILDGAGIITINGPFPRISLSQCFGSSITVVFGDQSIKEAYPEWWGTNNQVSILAAIKSVVTNVKRVYVPKGSYLFTACLDFASAFAATSYDGFEFICHPEAYFTANTATVNPIVYLRTTATGQFLSSTFEFGIINGSTNAVESLVMSGVNDSTVKVKKIIGCAGTNGVSLYIPDAFNQFVANNFIYINRIIECGHGISLRSPTTGSYGVQANQIFVGQIISCTGNGIIVGADAVMDNSVLNTFYLGAVELNGVYGIRDYSGGNKYFIGSTNTNTTAGFKLEAGARFTEIQGNLQDTTPFSDSTGGKLCINGVHSLLAFTDGDTTPSVKSDYSFIPKNFSCGNTGATTITQFHNGTPGQTIIVRIDANTTIQNNANVLLAGGADFSGDANDIITLLCIAVDTWRERSRSTN